MLKKTFSTGVKHWCEICRTYVQPNPISIRLHEQGTRHKTNLHESLRGKLKDEQDDKRKSDELQRTLQEMDREARAAMKINSEIVSNESEKDHLNDTRVTGGSTKWKSQHFEGHINPNNTNEDKNEDEPKGLYSIRGIHYVMGEHVPKESLLPGCACEVEIDDKWVSATVSGSPREVIVPNTSLTIRYYRLRLGENGGFGEMEARPSSMRICISEEEKDSMIIANKTMLDAKKQVLEGETTHESLVSMSSLVLPVDENTGIGAWTTISVIQEDDKKPDDETLKPFKRRKRDDIELDPSKALDLDIYKLSNTKRLFAAATSFAPDDEEGNTDFQSGNDSYRGVKLGAEPSSENVMNASSISSVVANVTVPTEVAFIKPRKGPPVSVRRRRDED
jgi:hypothetical protein